MINHIMQVRVREDPITWGNVSTMYVSWTALSGENRTWQQLMNRQKVTADVKITANTWGDLFQYFLSWGSMSNYYIDWHTITLGSNVDRVSGIVNGQEYTFIFNGLLWSAEIPQAADGIYIIEADAYYNNNWLAVARSTIYRKYTVIYDRTRADVEQGTAKGFYNTSDLNRVEYDCYYLQQLLYQQGYYTGIEERSSWAWLMNDFPTRADTRRLLDNVQSLVDAFYVLRNTPELPATMSGMGFTGANDIEKIIHDLKSALDYMISQFIYSGEIHAGEW